MGEGAEKGKLNQVTHPEPIRAAMKYRHDLSLDFLEAVFGVEKELEVPRMETCDTCTGSGIKPGTEPRVCTVCNGTGQVIICKLNVCTVLHAQSRGFPFKNQKASSKKGKGAAVYAVTALLTCRMFLADTEQVITVARTPLGNFQQVSTCSNCGGTGQTFTACSTCGGDGRVRKVKKIALTVPVGVDNGR